MKMCEDCGKRAAGETDPRSPYCRECDPEGSRLYMEIAAGKREPLPITLFHAHLDTRNFSFDAYGVTEEEARDAVLAGWTEHCRQTGAQLDYFQPDAVTIQEVRTGAIYRDGSLLFPPS